MMFWEPQGPNPMGAQPSKFTRPTSLARASRMSWKPSGILMFCGEYLTDMLAWLLEGLACGGVFRLMVLRVLNCIHCTSWDCNTIWGCWGCWGGAEGVLGGAEGVLGVLGGAGRWGCSGCCCSGEVWHRSRCKLMVVRCYAWWVSLWWHMVEGDCSWW